MLAMKIIDHGKIRTKNHNLLPRLGGNHQFRVKATSRLSKVTERREGNQLDAYVEYTIQNGVKETNWKRVDNHPTYLDNILKSKKVIISDNMVAHKDLCELIFLGAQQLFF